MAVGWPTIHSAKIDQAQWLRHNGQVQGDMSWMAKDLLVLKAIWGRGERLEGLVRDKEAP
jgi:hypothetical protein